MEWSVLVGYGVTYGLVVSVLFTVALFVGAAVGRDFLLDDYPPAVRERYGRPKSVRGRRTAIGFGLFFWGGCCVPLMVLAMSRLGAELGGDVGFLRAAVVGAVGFLTLSVYDLVVVDWIVFAGLRPRLLALPGTEGMEEYRDLRFHAVAAAKGSPLIVVVGVVVGGVVAAVEAIT
ncbi:hypothetical protein GCM10017600_80350 [Streptosporangium carneum]|uniref:Uncharacterized protein n=2 Tax=Streptosporangium carneum TaxID=47481 RepID=A0A9W6MI66_9ACTN|nr:hypothetical protein GCM10017600_80350 [Streptosporangium carneum]